MYLANHLVPVRGSVELAYSAELGRLHTGVTIMIRLYKLPGSGHPFYTLSLFPLFRSTGRSLQSKQNT